VRSPVFVAILWATLGAPCALAADDPVPFEDCVKSLRLQAETQHIDTATLDAAFATLTFDQRVIDLDRKQPEFTETLANYLSRAVTAQRVTRGRELARTNRELLARLRSRYGVPGQYLLALWGLESNFGTVLGSFPTLNSLATLACDPRRSAYFTSEFMAALKVSARGDMATDDLVGSWAGAIGGTQFMPSAYLRFAVDGDGDGHADLRRSVPDVLTSTANYLSQSGWQTRQRWGREVILPKNFAFERLGLDEPRTLEEWRALGVKDTSGSLVASLDAPASMLVPAGHSGPVFLVYDNFRVLMHWNRSEWYSIAAGYLADRIAGTGELRVKPSATQRRLTRDEVLTLQQRLNEAGFTAGTPDGMFGSGTRKAVRQLQLAKGFTADGYPDERVFEALNAK
jgi:membrane-bound lytic murein transglycosylase B